MVSEKNPVIKAKRRAGRVKRWVKRKVYERNIGKQYKLWLAEAAAVETGSTDHDFVISIIVPVYNPPIAFLDECLNSVVAQQARNWQLVVANDGSTKAEVGEFLDSFAATHAADPRITVVSKQNGGISSALNAALDLATGEYVGMLDHDDVLDRRCIEAFSTAIEHAITDGARPDAVYSDEDKVNPRGEHFELYCKPDFSPELLLTQMYLCHFTVFKREQMQGIGGLRTDMDGAQDFDLALRLLPQLAHVVHLPRPYYHWRAWSESTALTIDAKPWAQQAGAKAQQANLERVFGGGTVQPSRVPGLNEVHPRVEPGHRVSVIIPTIGTMNLEKKGRFIDDAVRTLVQREMQTELEIIVVTTGVIPPVLAPVLESSGELAPFFGTKKGANSPLDSVDGEERAVDGGVQHTITQIVYETSDFNFAEAINLGRAHATGDYLLLLNDDTTVAEDNPVTRMLEIGQIDEVGITGARLTYPDGRLQHVGMVLLPSGPTHCWISKPGKEPGYFGSTLTPRNYSAVTAAAMLVRTSVFDDVNGFDTVFARDFNDVDFCLRVRETGKRVAWTPYAHFTHHEGASIARRKADPAEASVFHQRWDAKYDVDPYYSPALNQQLARIYEAL